MTYAMPSVAVAMAFAALHRARQAMPVHISESDDPTKDIVTTPEPEPETRQQRRARERREAKAIRKKP